MNDLAIDMDECLGTQGFRLQLDCRLALNGVTAIYGPSGAGKTTLLRCIAGLQAITGGSIRFRHTLWQDASTQLPTHQRRLAYVCQQPDLFTHLTVQGNLNYALRRAKGRPQQVSTNEVIALLALAPLLSRRIEQLSGGECQRVALARALLSQPELLLLDEPLAGVDQQQRANVLPYLQRLCAAQFMPILYVSHELAEIASLAQHIVHLVNGRLLQQGSTSAMLPRLYTSHDASAEIAALRRENARLTAQYSQLLNTIDRRTISQS